MNLRNHAFSYIATGEGSAFEGKVQLMIAGDLSLGYIFMCDLASDIYSRSSGRFSGDITVLVDSSCHPLTPLPCMQSLSIASPLRIGSEAAMHAEYAPHMLLLSGALSWRWEEILISTRTRSLGLQLFTVLSLKATSSSRSPEICLLGFCSC